MAIPGLTEIAATQAFTVPTPDSADNTTMRDVIGNKTDTNAGDSLYSYAVRQQEYNRIESEVYPTLAVGATVVSAAANWAYGAYATVVPINTIATNFCVRSIAIETCDTSAVFQLALYRGVGDNLIATTRFAVIGGFWGNSVYVIHGEQASANERIRVRVASSDGAINQATLTISICYTACS